MLHREVGGRRRRGDERPMAAIELLGNIIVISFVIESEYGTNMLLRCQCNN